MTNVYEKVTNRVIEQMSRGIVPWQKPWKNATDGGEAVSYTSRKPYSLLNQMLLGKPGEYLTFKQVKELGGNIRKGAKAEFVVFFTFVEKKEVNADGEEKETRYPILRYYNVFHIDDCEGVETKFKTGDAEVKEEPKGIEFCDSIVSDYSERTNLKVTIMESNGAYYSPSRDEVVCPTMSQHDSPEDFYSTLFHELTHSTGHKSRLDRMQSSGNFSMRSNSYSREELIAEMGSAMLVSHCGIDTEKVFRNSVAYLQSWVKAFKDDVQMIVWAASRAEKAVKLILNQE